MALPQTVHPYLRRIQPALAVTVPLLALFVGGMIYALWRSPTLWMFQWFDTVGAGGFVDGLREAAGHWGSLLPDWLVYSAPDGAWVFAGVFIFASLWPPGTGSWARRCWIGAIPVLALGSEFAQCAGFLPGVFDWGDVIAYTAAAIVSLYASELLHRHV